jgi:nanoRNase/pAp phosphatase (c-di-AMP/oligoRNAs hydrolase)
MDEWKFVHPKDVQDGLVQVTKDDILANVPYVPGVGMWFDHHSSEKERLRFQYKYEGASELKPSCARVIWDFYGGKNNFPELFLEMMDYVDKCDSGQLTRDEVLQPKGWVLLSFIMDPRTGLGRYKDYRISNYNLMMNMVEWCGSLPIDEILSQPDVQERIERYFKQNELFQQQLTRCTFIHNNLAVIDLRDEVEIFTGNRFLVYSLFPDCNISMHVMWGREKQNVVFTVGHSIINRTSKTDVGKLMLEYDGGGHERVGTCQVATLRAERIKSQLIESITADG